MSDLIDGVVVEFFDIDYEIEKMKANENEAIVYVDEDPQDLDALMDDDSGESNWLEQAEEHYLNSFGD